MSIPPGPPRLSGARARLAPDLIPIEAPVSGLGFWPPLSENDPMSRSAVWRAGDGNPGF